MAGKNLPKLTPRQRLFVNAYLIKPDATAAAIKAGYSAKTAKPIGFENLKKPAIAAHIDANRKKVDEKTLMDAAAFREHLHNIIHADIADVLDDLGKLKPVSEWPAVWRKMVVGIDITELFEGRGKDREVIGELKKIKAVNREKVMEMYGRHVGVQAFKDQVEHTASDKLVEALNAGRRRTS